MNDDLYYFMAAHEDDDAPDGAWQGMLENAVDIFNMENKTNYDSFDMFMAYVVRSAEEQKEKEENLDGC